MQGEWFRKKGVGTVTRVAQTVTTSLVAATAACTLALLTEQLNITKTMLSI